MEQFFTFFQKKILTFKTTTKKKLLYNRSLGKWLEKIKCDKLTIIKTSNKLVNEDCNL